MIELYFADTASLLKKAEIDPDNVEYMGLTPVYRADDVAEVLAKIAQQLKEVWELQQRKKLRAQY